MNLGEVIKRYRNNNNLSMGDFSKKCGLSKAYISMLEKNINSTTGKEVTPTFTTMQKCAKAMNININDLIKILDDQPIKVNTDDSIVVSKIAILGSMEENTIHNRIRELRQKKGLSQEQFSLKCGYKNKSTISMIEKGKRDVPMDMLQNVADALGVSVAYLFTGEEEQATDMLEVELLKYFRRLTQRDQKKIIYDIKYMLNEVYIEVEKYE